MSTSKRDSYAQDLHDEYDSLARDIKADIIDNIAPYIGTLTALQLQLIISNAIDDAGFVTRLTRVLNNAGTDYAADAARELNGYETDINFENPSVSSSLAAVTATISKLRSKLEDDLFVAISAIAGTAAISDIDSTISDIFVKDFSVDDSVSMSDIVFRAVMVAATIAFVGTDAKYRYVGPDDEKTREFCREHLGEVKTLAEWDALDNGQILPVSIYGGGYNCRHWLEPA